MSSKIRRARFPISWDKRPVVLLPELVTAYYGQLQFKALPEINLSPGDLLGNGHVKEHNDVGHVHSTIVIEVERRLVVHDLW